jgi:hypothetical protein
MNSLSVARKSGHLANALAVRRIPKPNDVNPVRVTVHPLLDFRWWITICQAPRFSVIAICEAIAGQRKILHLVPLRCLPMGCEPLDYSKNCDQAPAAFNVPGIPPSNSQIRHSITHLQTWCEIPASAGCGYRRKPRFEIWFPSARTVYERRERIFLNRLPTAGAPD